MISFENVQVLLLFLKACNVMSHMTIVRDVCGTGPASPEIIVKNPISCPGSEQKLNGCPVTSYTFPSNPEDYISVTGSIPDLNSGTVCSWIDLKNGNMAGTWFSYATSNHIDSLSVFGRREFLGKNSRIDIQINSLGYYPKFYVEGKERIHLCLVFSTSGGFLKWYVDGGYFMETPIHVTQPIEGGGVLIVGQEQDKLGGGFESTQAYEGDISNFMMWTRPLAQCEILDIATKCICPKDYNVTLHHKNVYISGAVSGKVLNDCPIVKRG